MATTASTASKEIEKLRQRAIAKLTQRYGKALVRFIYAPEHTTNVLIPLAVQELTTKIQDKRTTLSEMKKFVETTEKLQQFRIDDKEVRSVLNVKRKGGGGIIGKMKGVFTGRKTGKVTEAAVKEAATQVEQVKEKVTDPECQAQLEAIQQQLQACGKNLTSLNTAYDDLKKKNVGLQTKLTNAELDFTTKMTELNATVGLSKLSLEEKEKALEDIDKIVKPLIESKDIVSPNTEFQRVKTVVNKYKLLKQEILDKAMEVKEAEEQLDKAQQKLTNKTTLNNKEIENLSTKLKDAQAALKACTEDKTLLQKDYNDSETFRKLANKEVKEKESEIKTLEEKIAKLKEKQMSSLNPAEFKKLERKIRECESQKITLQNEKEEANKERRIAKEKLDRQRKEIEMVETLKKDLQIANREKDAFVSQSRNLKKLIDETTRIQRITKNFLVNSKNAVKITPQEIEEFRNAMKNAPVGKQVLEQVEKILKEVEEEKTQMGNFSTQDVSRLQDALNNALEEKKDLQLQLKQQYEKLVKEANEFINNRTTSLNTKSEQERQNLIQEFQRQENIWTEAQRESLDKIQELNQQIAELREANFELEKTIKTQTEENKIFSESNYGEKMDVDEDVDEDIKEFTKDLYNEILKQFQPPKQLQRYVVLWKQASGKVVRYVLSRPTVDTKTDQWRGQRINDDGTLGTARNYTFSNKYVTEEIWEEKTETTEPSASDSKSFMKESIDDMLDGLVPALPKIRIPERYEMD